MKNSGIVRKIDELGRIVIPKEIRKTQNIREGDSLEIYINDNNIILKKYNESNSILNLANKLSCIVNEIYDIDLIVTDKEKIISSSINNIINKKIDNSLLYLIDNRESFISDTNISKKFNDEEISGYYTIYPIIINTDSIGLIIFISKELIKLDKLSRLILSLFKDKFVL